MLKDPFPRLRMPALLLALILPGCAAPELGAPETFHWAAQAIAFRPPPAGWRREGTNSRELGVRFIKERSVGEAISIGEYYAIGERDRRAELHELAGRVPALDDYHLRRALELARWRTQDTFSAGEAATAAAVNECVDRAMSAYLRGDRDAVRNEIQAAETAARGLRYTLDDVLAGVEFRPDRRNEPWRYRVTGRRRITIAGESAARVDYDIRLEEGVRRCSEVYVMRGNHLFIASYIGLASHLPLYDRVIGSITFPAEAEARS